MSEFVAIDKPMPRRDPAAEDKDLPYGTFALRPPLVAKHGGAATYIPAPGLLEAADVAMMLGVPLLLTGEAGTGKTRSAGWLADKLGLREPLKMDVKSSTTGSDLLYSFDEVARFRDAHGNRERPLVDYLRFSAFGLGILRGGGATASLTDMFGDPPSADSLELAFGKSAVGQDPQAHLLFPRDAALGEPEHSVVLIDELDKAPRDTPNDLLAEFDAHSFAIPELGLRVTAGAKRPIVILTSNSERSLPVPFLRRCAYFDIPFPKKDEIAKIVSQTLGGHKGPEQALDAPESASVEIASESNPPIRFGPDSPLLKEAIDVFFAIRTEPLVRKNPGTAEMLAWFDILLRRLKLSPAASLAKTVREKRGVVERTLCALLKSADDMEVGERILRQSPEA